MKDIIGSRIRIAIVILLVLLALAYLYFIAPGYTKDIGELRMQSKLMQYDITAIDDMAGDETKLDEDIELSRKTIDDIKSRTSQTDKNVIPLLHDIADKTKLSVATTSIEGSPSPAPVPDEKRILMQRITLQTTGTYKQGASFMKLLESSKTAFFAIDSFAYTGQDNTGAVNTAPNKSAPKSTWIFALTLYYYE